MCGYNICNGNCGVICEREVIPYNPHAWIDKAKQRSDMRFRLPEHFTNTSRLNHQT